MKSATALTKLPAISVLIEDDPFFARMREYNQSIVLHAYELFKESGFKNVHDLEVWRRAVSEMLQQVPVQVTETDSEIDV